MKVAYVILVVYLLTKQKYDSDILIEYIFRR